MDDIHSLTPEIRSFALVGMFLQAWAFMEQELRRAIEKGLGLNGLQAAMVCSNMQLRDKINLLKTLVHISLPVFPAEKEKFITALNKVATMSSKRNMLAHDVFGPSDDGKSVAFFVIKAKGKLEFPDTIWSPADFMKECAEIRALTTEFEEMTRLLKAVDSYMKLADQANAPPTSTPNPLFGGTGLLGLLSPLPEELQSSDTKSANPEIRDGNPPERQE
jgi:hypothetical protein